MNSLETEKYYDKLIELTHKNELIWHPFVPYRHGEFKSERNGVFITLESMGFVVNDYKRYYYTGNEKKHKELVDLIQKQLTDDALNKFFA